MIIDKIGKADLPKHDCYTTVLNIAVNKHLKMIMTKTSILEDIKDIFK